MAETSSIPRGLRKHKLAPEQVRRIAECIAAGERHSVVAERFGVSVETVGAIKSGKRWAGALDDELRRRMETAKVTATLDASSARRIIRALEDGRPGRTIAEEFGVSESMVSAIKRGRAWASLDPGLPDRLAQKEQQGKALSEPQVASIKRLLLEGASSRQVAARFGVSASTIQAISQGKTWAAVEPADTGEPPTVARRPGSVQPPTPRNG